MKPQPTPKCFDTDDNESPKKCKKYCEHRNKCEEQYKKKHQKEAKAKAKKTKKTQKTRKTTEQNPKALLTTPLHKKGRVVEK